MIGEIAFSIQTCVCERLAAVERPITCCCIGLERPTSEPAYVLVAPNRVQPEDDQLETKCLPTSWRTRLSVIIGRCIKDNTCNGTSSEALTFIDDIEQAMFAISCCNLPGGLENAAIVETNFRLFEDDARVFNEAEIIVEIRSRKPWGDIV